MKPVLCFLGQLNGFLNLDIGSMRHRISAATLPYTCRKLSRKHDRIPSLNRNGCMPIFGSGMTCGMPPKNRLFQGFLMTFLNQGIA
jgi:hypothetical protein